MLENSGRAGDQAAYRQLVLQYLPDVCPSSRRAESTCLCASLSEVWWNRCCLACGIGVCRVLHRPPAATNPWWQRAGLCETWCTQSWATHVTRQRSVTCASFFKQATPWTWHTRTRWRTDGRRDAIGAETGWSSGVPFRASTLLWPHPRGSFHELQPGSNPKLRTRLNPSMDEWFGFGFAGRLQVLYSSGSTLHLDQLWSRFCLVIGPLSGLLTSPALPLTARLVAQHILALLLNSPWSRLYSLHVHNWNWVGCYDLYKQFQDNNDTHKEDWKLSAAFLLMFWKDLCKLQQKELNPKQSLKYFKWYHIPKPK